MAEWYARSSVAASAAARRADLHARHDVAAIYTAGKLAE
jgi:hypothetical protein